MGIERARPPEPRPETFSYDAGVLQDDVEFARRVLAGELVFADTIYADLAAQVSKASKADLETPLGVEARQLLEALPRAEVRNCLSRALKWVDAGDDVSARQWTQEADKRLRLLADGYGERAGEGAPDIGPELNANV